MGIAQDIAKEIALLELAKAKANAKQNLSNIGTYDWVGNSDYGNKANYYAGIHVGNTPYIKVGDTLYIRHYLATRVLKINQAGGTAVLDVAANSIPSAGVWSKSIPLSAEGDPQGGEVVSTPTTAYVPPKKNLTPLFVGLGIIAAVGGVWYFTQN